MINTILTGGQTAERLLRNRGRSRIFISAINRRITQQRFERFIDGKWRPNRAVKQSDYAISLTSWSARINDLQLTLMMLINQDRRPSGIHVWLTEADRELIPTRNRVAFESHGVRFRDCPDYRAHKKWLPMILSGHRSPFVVCDDDIFYPREWFGRLISEDREDAYVGCKCHRIIMSPNGSVAPYCEWEKQIYHHQQPSMLFFTTGCGGEILHPMRLPDSALDWHSIREHALFNDDIWLKGAHLAAGVPVYRTRYSFPCLELPGTDQSGLLANHNASQNDEQIEAVWNFFSIRSLIGRS